MTSPDDDEETSPDGVDDVLMADELLEGVRPVLLHPGQVRALGRVRLVLGGLGHPGCCKTWSLKLSTVLVLAVVLRRTARMPRTIYEILQASERIVQHAAAYILSAHSTADNKSNQVSFVRRN